MPAMANITVKKADGTTDIVFDAVAASGGDSSPAVWRQDTGAAATLPVGLRSTFRMWTEWNGSRTARRQRIQFRFPYAVQDSTTTLFSAKDSIVGSAEVTVPQAIPAANINEGVYQGWNLVGSLLCKQSGAAGYAPT